MLRKFGSLGFMAFCFAVLSIAFLQAPTLSYGFDISIEVAPSTLNIQSDGSWVTVHTDIPYSSVLGASVELNSIPISWSKVDNQGYFVAKFLMSEVKNLYMNGALVLGENEVTLFGLTTIYEEFTGAQTINVIDISPIASGGK